MGLDGEHLLRQMARFTPSHFPWVVQNYSVGCGIYSAYRDGVLW